MTTNNKHLLVNVEAFQYAMMDYFTCTGVPKPPVQFTVILHTWSSVLYFARPVLVDQMTV